MEIRYCAFCDNEAEHHIVATGTPMCTSCKAIYEAGQASPNSIIEDGIVESVNEEVVVQCVCMTCGTRNTPGGYKDGFCKNGHDNWLEYRDVMGHHPDAGEINRIAMKVFNLSLIELEIKFISGESFEDLIVKEEK